ncbi:MAG TPA: hypothetical protein V6C96_01285, partial [Vampirovibrionales bacterium]
PNIFPENPLNKLFKSNKEQGKGSQTNKNVAGSAKENPLASLFKLPPHKIVSQLSGLLEKSLKDPNVEKLLTQFKIPLGSQQAIAFSAFACLKELLAKTHNLTPDEEKAILKAILEEFDSVEDTDPDERKKKQKEKNKKKKERKAKSNPKVNAYMLLVEETMNTLGKKYRQINLES